MTPDIPASKHTPPLKSKVAIIRTSFVAMLLLLHSVTNMQETSLHESSRYMESIGKKPGEVVMHAQ